MKDKRMATLTDQELLARFFAEAKAPVADNGFSARVMQQIASMQAERVLTRRAALSTLARWNFWLNAIGVLAGIALLVRIGFFSRAWELIHMVVYRVIAGIITFDADDLLVRLMLFLHQLRDITPSFMQWCSLGLTIFVLLVLGVQRLVQMEERGRW